VDYGEGATGVFTTATHDFVGTDRFEILGDSGKIVVECGATATITRLKKPERELSDAMDQQDISKLLSGTLIYPSTTPRRSSRPSRNGACSMLECWRTLRPTFLTALH